MEGRRSGSPGGMKWQVRCKQEKFGKLQVVFICFKLGATESDQSRNDSKHVVASLSVKLGHKQESFESLIDRDCLVGFVVSCGVWSWKRYSMTVYPHSSQTIQEEGLISIILVGSRYRDHCQTPRVHGHENLPTNHFYARESLQTQYIKHDPSAFRSPIHTERHTSGCLSLTG
jgi:hypothetical protein